MIDVNKINEYDPEDDVILNLIDEAYDLTHKIIRLKRFLKSGKKVSDDQREYLLKQYEVMVSYVSVLFQRTYNLLQENKG